MLALDQFFCGPGPNKSPSAIVGPNCGFLEISEISDLRAQHTQGTPDQKQLLE